MADNQYLTEIAAVLRPKTLLRAQRLAALLATLAKVAGVGAPCPNNDEIVNEIGLNGSYEVSPLLDDLESGAFIVVERVGYRRRATIVATGKTTEWSRATGGRKRLGNGRRDPDDPKALAGDFRGDLPESRYVYRDPCPCCGVRRDVGCAHQPLIGVAA